MTTVTRFEVKVTGSNPVAPTRVFIARATININCIYLTELLKFTEYNFFSYK